MPERKSTTPNSLSKNTLMYLLAVLVLVLVGFVLALSKLPKNDYTNQHGNNGENEEEVSSIYMELEHGYVADANTFSGSIESPTPCHTLKTDAEISESNPEQITLKFSTEASAEPCAQVMSEKDFTIVVPSAPNAQLVAVTLNGEKVNFNLEQD